MKNQKALELDELRAELEALRVSLEQERASYGRDVLKRHLDALVQLNTEVRFRAPLKEGVRATFELVAEVLEVDRASGWLLDPERTLLECIDLYEKASGEHSVGATLEAADYPAYFEAVLTQRAVDASQARTDPRTAEFADSYLEPLDIHSMLDAAIRREGRTLGVVCVEKTGAPRHWTIDEVSFVGQVADHIARIFLEDERRRGEEALVLSERNYREIFNATSDALFIQAEDGRIIDVNDQMCAMFGCTREQALAASVSAFSQGESPYGPADAADAMHRARRDGQQTFEWRSRRLDGELFWSEVSLRAKEIAGAMRIVASVRDISARKAQEEERRILQEQLQHASKMEAVGRLAGGIAHDFNNLLTAIIAGIELVEMDLPSDSPNHEVLADILAATGTAAAVTRQLLTFSRRQLVEPQAVDLSELVARVQPMLGRLIGEDVSMVLELDHDAWAVRADPSQLEQVVMNLAINARDAMPKGGTLRVVTANTTLTQEQLVKHPACCPGDYVRLSVIDTGHGISLDILERVFEPFFTTKPVGHGTGLGLSTTFGIVQQAEGFIDVTSTVDEGTAFHVFLPRHMSIEGATKKPRPIGKLPRGTETILLVEDEDAVRNVIVPLLGRLGYHVLWAIDGDSALDIARHSPETIDLLLTDVVLPGINGRDLAEAFSALRPGARIIFSSGYTEDVVLRHGLVEHHFNFLRKPYSLRGLAFALREALDP